MVPVDEVRCKFSGRIFLLGNGPSLKENNLDLLDKSEVMSINRAGRDCPGAKFHLCSGDLTQLGTTPEYILFYGVESMYPTPRLAHINSKVILTRIQGPGHIFEEKPSIGLPRALDLRYGWQVTAGGVLAIYIAWWMGYNPIYLLGYDGYGTHYTDRHGGEHIPDHEKNVPEFEDKIDLLLKYNPRLEVINLNHKSRYCNLFVRDFLSVL